MIIRSGANDATRATNKLYALQKSCDSPINLVALTTFTLVCIRCFTGEAVNKLHIK